MEFNKDFAIPLPDKFRNSEIPCGDGARVDKRSCKLPVAAKSGAEKISPCKAARSLNVIKEGEKLASAKTCASEVLNETDLARTRVTEKSRFKADNEFGTQMNQLVIQAAMGGWRWPPYLLVVWVLILVVSHALHFIVMLLKQMLPALKQLFAFLRRCAEEAWRDDKRKMAAALAAAAAATYALHLLLFAVFLIINWFLEPLSTGERVHGSDDERNEDIASNEVVTELA